MNKFKEDVIYAMYSEVLDIIYTCELTHRHCFPWIKNQPPVFEVCGTYDDKQPNPFCYEVSPRDDVKLGVL
jgi:hypothetical protein